MLRGDEVAAMEAAVREYKRRGCPASSTQWTFHQQHRFAVAHLAKCAAEGKGETDDWGVYSHTLPRATDSGPAPLPDFVLKYEEEQQQKLDKSTELSGGHLALQDASKATDHEENIPSAGYTLAVTKTKANLLHPDLDIEVELDVSSSYIIYQTPHGDCISTSDGAGVPEYCSDVVKAYTKEMQARKKTQTKPLAPPPPRPTAKAQPGALVPYTPKLPGMTGVPGTTGTRVFGSCLVKLQIIRIPEL